MNKIVAIRPLSNPYPDSPAIRSDTLDVCVVGKNIAAPRPVNPKTTASTKHHTNLIDIEPQMLPRFNT